MIDSDLIKVHRFLQCDITESIIRIIKDSNRDSNGGVDGRSCTATLIEIGKQRKGSGIFFSVKKETEQKICLPATIFILVHGLAW